MRKRRRGRIYLKSGRYYGDFRDLGGRQEALIPNANDPAVVLDAIDESAVPELVLLQPAKRIVPASRAIPPVFRISPPVNAAFTLRVARFP